MCCENGRSGFCRQGWNVYRVGSRCAGTTGGRDRKLPAHALRAVVTGIGECMTLSLATVLIAIVAFLQTLISLVEIFLWNVPRVHGRLHFTAAEARKVAPLVANAGLYNGFLAAGLVWGLLSTGDANSIKMFFLGCVIVAGIFG